MDDFAANLRHSIEELSATILQSKRLRMEFKTLENLAHEQRAAAGQQPTPARIEPFAWFEGYDPKVRPSGQGAG